MLRTFVQLELGRRFSGVGSDELAGHVFFVDSLDVSDHL